LCVITSRPSNFYAALASLNRRTGRCVLCEGSIFKCQTTFKVDGCIWLCCDQRIRLGSQRSWCSCLYRRGTAGVQYTASVSANTLMSRRRHTVWTTWRVLLLKGDDRQCCQGRFLLSPHCHGLLPPMVFCCGGSNRFGGCSSMVR